MCFPVTFYTFVQLTVNICCVLPQLVPQLSQLSRVKCFLIPKAKYKLLVRIFSLFLLQTGLESRTVAPVTNCRLSFNSSMFRGSLFPSSPKLELFI